MSALTLSNLKKSFGNVQIIKGIDLEVAEREFVVFVGPSGCGKSTLLRMIAGLEDVTDGEIQIAGKKVNDMPPVKRGIAMVFQSYALYPHMSVYENIAFPLRVEKRSKADIDAKVAEAARILQLDNRLQQKPGTLSGGQRQRVAIGRAIVREPKIFLFDEPLSNLDAALRGEMRIELTRLHRELGATMIYVTHDQVEAMTMADRIVVLNAGEIAQVGAPLELYHKPANVFVANFIGNPRMNFIAATCKAVSDSGVTVEFSDGQTGIIPVVGRKDVVGQAVTLGVRPEHISEVRGDFELTMVPNAIERLGMHTVAYAQLDGCESFCALLPGNSRVKIDTPFKLGFKVSDCHLFDSQEQAFERDVDLSKVDPNLFKPEA